MTSHPAQDRRDPRLDRSRSAILAAAVELLSDGGVKNVTIDAITARSGVARSTLYRHFATNTELLAAAFQELLPPLDQAVTGASPRDRLLRLVLAQAEQIDEAPTVAALVWMSTVGLSADEPAGTEERTQLDALREHIVDSYRRPFDAVLAECLRPTEARREGAVDDAAAQLIGPLLFAKLISKRANDKAFCTRVVDDFLARHG